MKKIILSLSALFVVAAVSAQSYPKQPDPTIVEYIPYKKPAAPATEVKEATTTEQDTKQAQPNRDRKEENTSGEVKATSAVAVNDVKSTSAKKNK